MTPPVAITTIIEDKTVTRAEVERWEARRAAAVLKKLGSRMGRRAAAEIVSDDISALVGLSLDRQRAALLALKTGLGHAGIYAVLNRELAVSERVARVAVATSRGGVTCAVTRLFVPGCSAVAFSAWFDNLTAANLEADMVAACPDHYLLRRLPDGRQEVVETTGGSPMATRFVVDYAATHGVSTPAQPDYPVQIVGTALLDDGLAIGGVRHQFRDKDGSMEALLTVEFPKLFPPVMVAAHRWHLAAEFGNWITASMRDNV